MKEKFGDNNDIVELRNEIKQLYETIGVLQNELTEVKLTSLQIQQNSIQSPRNSEIEDTTVAQEALHDAATIIQEESLDAVERQARRSFGHYVVKTKNFVVEKIKYLLSKEFFANAARYAFKKLKDNLINYVVSGVLAGTVANATVEVMKVRTVDDVKKIAVKMQEDTVKKVEQSVTKKIELIDSLQKKMNANEEMVKGNADCYKQTNAQQADCLKNQAQLFEQKINALDRETNTSSNGLSNSSSELQENSRQSNMNNEQIESTANTKNADENTTVKIDTAKDNSANTKDNSDNTKDIEQENSNLNDKNTTNNSPAAKDTNSNNQNPKGQTSNNGNLGGGNLDGGLGNLDKTTSSEDKINTPINNKPEEENSHSVSPNQLPEIPIPGTSSWPSFAPSEPSPS